MKRRVTKTRLVLAALLLAVAGLSFAYWPRTPRARFKAGEILGFDQAGRVLTRDSYPIESKAIVLLAWDLATGLQQERIELRLAQEASSDRPELTISPDGRRAAVWESRGSKISVFSLPDGKQELQVSCDPAEQYERPENKQPYLFEDKFLRGGGLTSQAYLRSSRVERVTFSNESKLLVATTIGGICAWELGERRLQTDKLTGPFTVESSVRLEISPDRRFVLNHGFMHGAQIREIKTARLVQTFPGVSAACFLDDGVVAVVEYDGKIAKLKRVQLNEHDVARVAETPLPADEVPLTLQGGKLVTSKLGKLPFDWPEWIPSKLTTLADDWLGPNSARVRIWDASTLMEENAFMVDLDTRRLRETINFSMSHANARSSFIGTSLRSFVAVSPDGTSLLIRWKGGWSIWDIPPRRPLTAWLTTGAITLLALFLARLRKFKPSPAAPLPNSPHSGTAGPAPSPDTAGSPAPAPPAGPGAAPAAAAPAT